jgi:transposase-like protein
MAQQIARETRLAILADYERGVKVEAIAAQYGVSIATPTTLARRFGVPARRAPEVSKIRQLMAEGKDTLDIARAFNVPESQIWNRLARA